ncbi:MAG: hypothetical protein AAF267_11435 [Deinococcota bacterium]
MNKLIGLGVMLVIGLGVMVALGEDMATFDTGLITIDCTVTDESGVETGDVCLLEPDGTVTNLTNVPAGSYAYRGYFNNDCSRIVFYGNFEDTEDIYTMAVDGTDLQRITNDDARDYNASYSPDGTQITWVSHVEDAESGDIWVINADGSGARNLTPGDFRDRTPFFSPDGSVIGFHSYRGEEGYGNIYMLGTDDGELEQITSGAHRFFAYNVEWSPDGSQILFLTERDGTVDIYTMAADGSNEQLVLSDVGHTVANWSPDATQMVFNSNRSEAGDFRQMFISNIDGSGVQPLEPLSVDEGNYFGVRDWCLPSN